MFNIFNKKSSKISKLEKKHDKLLEQAFKLSKSNRKLSDQKTAEADEVMKEIELLKNAEKQ